MQEKLLTLFFGNLRLKIYALLVSLTIWLIIIGQKSMVVKREVFVDYLVSSEMSLEKETSLVTLTIEARRPALKKFNATVSAPIVDLRELGAGSRRISIRKEDISLPLGAKIIDVEPRFVRVVLKPKANREEGKKNE